MSNDVHYLETAVSQEFKTSSAIQFSARGTCFVFKVFIENINKYNFKILPLRLFFVQKKNSTFYKQD